MEVKILKPLMTATCLILAALLASPAAAKDYNSLNDYTAGRAPYVSASIADATGTAVNDGRTWLAIKTIQCGKKRLVVWRERDDASDYYATEEVKHHNTFPRVKGLVYDDATGNTSLKGNLCTDTD
jgi:hypothetical protein